LRRRILRWAGAIGRTGFCKAERGQTACKAFGRTLRRAHRLAPGRLAACRACRAATVGEPEAGLYANAGQATWNPRFPDCGVRRAGIHRPSTNSAYAGIGNQRLSRCQLVAKAVALQVDLGLRARAAARGADRTGRAHTGSVRLSAMPRASPTTPTTPGRHNRPPGRGEHL
jgi:hypothetical protein